MSLFQGHITVAEYEKRFTKLAMYALFFVIDDTRKCNQFEEDLQTEIGTHRDQHGLVRLF